MSYLNSTGLPRLVLDLKNRLIPTIRKINGKTLNTDISLAASDIPQTAIALPNGVDPNVDEALRSLKEKINVLEGSSTPGLPPGMVDFFAGEIPPTGWLKANGAAVSRSAYPALFNAIGIIFGSGDGSTTFQLPDLRGEFIRGYDDGRGVDSGRAFGTSQAESIVNHFHYFAMHISPTTYQMDKAGLPGTTSPTTRLGISGLKGGYDGVSSPLSIGNVIGNPGENRPRNVALLACIKY